jgi:hypothetical protein
MPRQAALISSIEGTLQIDTCRIAELVLNAHACRNLFLFEKPASVDCIVVGPSVRWCCTDYWSGDTSL